jgi:predicted AlkP superfamily pyrophosphatase or phosphodiesterase
MKPVLCLDIVGLSPSHIGDNTPNLARLAQDGFTAPLGGVCPAVTCSAQSTMLTGLSPREHGIVGNGWYFRDLSEVFLWRQSNQLVHGERVWETAKKRDKKATTANLFWWYNMATSVDFSLTPRPLYFADGRKAPGVYGRPMSFREKIEGELGPFPLFNFWGPAAGLKSSEWIANSAKLALKIADPTIALVYLPHLDYDLQRFGPHDPRIAAELRAVDAVAGSLIEEARSSGRSVIVLSEYGIEDVTTPIHINRILRDAGFLETTPMQSRELLDFGASRAFAVADHQTAHVYVKDPSDIPAVRRVLERSPGIETVADRREQARFDVDHERSGELFCIAARGHWFTYYYWQDDAKAPDFARTVDIHKKPGYDPVELFVDPKISAPKLKIAWRIAKKLLGFRMLMDVIALDATIVRGSHGRPGVEERDGAILISSEKRFERPHWRMADIPSLILSQAFNS